jgi:Leucine-rich repeat (LRR) protein
MTFKVLSNGSLCVTSVGGVSAETSLDLHWENTEGVVCIVDTVPKHFPYLQNLNLEGQRVADVRALGSLLSLRELMASGNQLVDISHLSSCLLLTKLDLNDNMINEIPPGQLPLSLCILCTNNHVRTHETHSKRGN